MIELTKERDWRVARLGEELDKLLNLINFCRESLDNELTMGLGHKKLGVSDKDLRKVKDLAATMNSAIEAKIRYDRAAKAMIATMTPDEEFESVVTYIKALPPEQLARLRDRMRIRYEKDKGQNEVPSTQED